MLGMYLKAVAGGFFRSKLLFIFFQLSVSGWGNAFNAGQAVSSSGLAGRASWLLGGLLPLAAGCRGPGSTLCGSRWGSLYIPRTHLRKNETETAASFGDCSLREFCLCPAISCHKMLCNNPLESQGLRHCLCSSRASREGFRWPALPGRTASCPIAAALAPPGRTLGEQVARPPRLREAPFLSPALQPEGQAFCSLGCTY